MKEILSVKDLTYKSIFKDLNLGIKENTLNLITGSNKCGKTTLIEILSGIIEVENVCFFYKKDISKLKSYEFSTSFSHVIFTGSFNFQFSSLDQEILYELDKINITNSERKMKYKHLTKIFNIQDKLYDDINNLSYFEKMKSLVLISIIRGPKILLLDNVLDDLSEIEATEIINVLKRIGGMTIIIGSSSLSCATLFEYIHVLDKNGIILTGETLEVLKEDSMLNKLGLSLPFMVDLSIKLKYYGLVDDIMLDMNRMVDKLWK